MPLAWRWLFDDIEPTPKKRHRKTSKPTSVYNRGDIAEGIVGLAWALALGYDGDGEMPFDIFSKASASLLKKPNISAKTECYAITWFFLDRENQKLRQAAWEAREPRPEYKYRLEVHLSVAMSKDNMAGFLKGISQPGMEPYYKAIHAYANSKQIKRAKEWLKEKGITRVTIKAGGSHFPKDTKTDILVETTDDHIPLPFGNITLKCDTKQISMVSRNFNSSSPTSNARGIADLVEVLTGFQPSATLQASYDDAVWNKCDSESLLKAVEAVYEDVATQLHHCMETGHRTPSECLAVFAKGLRQEAVGASGEARPVQIRLNDKDSTFTYLDYGTLHSLAKLMETSLPDTKIDFKVTYQPGDREKGSQPYLYFSVAFDNINYGKIASIRPKIRHHRDNPKRIKEFKHYFQNEPGLEKLLMDVAVANKSLGYTILPDVVTYFRK